MKEEVEGQDGVEVVTEVVEVVVPKDWWTVVEQVVAPRDSIQSTAQR